MEDNMIKLNLKSLAVFLLCLHIASTQLNGIYAAPVVEPQQQQHELQQNAEIIKYENSNISVAGYDFAFKTSDGISRMETATVKNIGTEDEAISVQGTVSWVGPDGVQYTLNYLADENGFQPEGEHLPVAPEV